LCFSGGTGETPDFCFFRSSLLSHSKPGPSPSEDEDDNEHEYDLGERKRKLRFWRKKRRVALGKMKVERVKYVIWAAEPQRALQFYREVLGGEVVKASEVMCEVVICGATIGIHSGGQGERTWTGLTFQVPDVIAGAQDVVAGGGRLSREPQPEGDEPPHLAMCIDPEGNEFMLTRRRGN
jgi:lactoylglutathione lyase